MDTLTNHLHTVVNKTWNFAKRLNSQQDHEQNAIVGLAAEAGEVLDVGKKRWWHTPKKEGRRDELRAELGDVCYYLIKTIDVCGFTLDEVLKENRDKLRARYPEYFEGER